MDPRSWTKDFRELLQSLNDHGVEYLPIGGHAVACHGYPRATAVDDLKANINARDRTKDLAELDQLP